MQWSRVWDRITGNERGSASFLKKSAFEHAQYVRLTALIESLYERLPSLHSARLVGHSDIAPTRKTDPGPLVSWARLRASLSR